MRIEANVKSALNDFIKVSYLVGKPINSDHFNIDIQPPAHKVKKRPVNSQTLYGFIYKGKWLKIGVAGVKSGPRYTSQHYNPKSSRSALAKSILTDPNFLPFIQIDTIGPWIKKNCWRVDVHLSAQIGRPMLLLLEAFFHVRFSPQYEG